MNNTNRTETTFAQDLQQAMNGWDAATPEQRQAAHAATANSTIHVFERAGLGKAPFSFVGVTVKKYQACPGAPVQPGGTCAYCGNGIMECCIIKDSLGAAFLVGNVCVGKTSDRGLINEAKQAINRLKREAKTVKDDARIAAAKSLFTSEPRIRETLSTYPHPNDFMAEKGLRRDDYVDWMLQNAGISGQLQAARLIETTAAGLSK